MSTSTARKITSMGDLMDLANVQTGEKAQHSKAYLRKHFTEDCLKRKHRKPSLYDITDLMDWRNLPVDEKSISVVMAGMSEEEAAEVTEDGE